MASLQINRISKAKQYLACLILISVTGGISYAFSAFIDYRVVAFILLVTVSLIAMFLDILPVLFSALLSALVWDYFFIPPHFTLQVGNTGDRVLLLMYFIIAMINAVLTYKIRRIEKAVRDKEEKEHAVKLYNTLLNSLSHELRTPIAAIIGATDNLQNNNGQLSALHKNELVNEISKASLRLNQQVDNLLNMSRLESGFIEPRKDWCDISEVVYDAVKRIEEGKPGQKIHISIDPDIPLFRLDKGLLDQIIYNLLNNAVNYTDSRNNIYIIASCNADVLVLIIEDDGKGFPEQELDKVFDKFYRLKDARPGGTGLGLSIVKGFTEALNGAIALENVATGGARFTISIPAETSYLKNLKNG